MAKIKKAKADKTIRYQNHPSGSERCGLCAMYRSPAVDELRAERDRLRAALEGRTATIALHKILNLAQHGTPPDYHQWLSTLDNIAGIARRALGEK